MSDRAAAIDAFIAAAGWTDARAAPLAGDASNRRYLRLQRAGESSVLMDAPADGGEDIRPFLHIAAYLADLGLSAPRIIATDASQGLILMEDLGDDLFARVLLRDPSLEDRLYCAATDLLATLHRHSPPAGIGAYDVPLMADTATLAHDWYSAALHLPDSGRRHALRDTLAGALSACAPVQPVLVQRDYHAENLLWLPARSGIARVGLLDFQDAMRGHPAYDLVSLLQDARRDVPPALERAMIARYVESSGVAADGFEVAYRVLGAQRNLRIAGVFARLCLRDGKAQYIDLIPRVWGLLQRDLAHPALSGVAEIVNTAMPAPSPENLKRLKDQCATIPAPS